MRLFGFISLIVAIVFMFTGCGGGGGGSSGGSTGASGSITPVSTPSTSGNGGSQVGTTAANFTLQNPVNSSSVTLTSYKGNVVLLNFWRSG